MTVKVIREHSGFRLVWDALITALAVISCIIVPYQIAFDPAGETIRSGTYYLISGIFLVDICLNCLTSYRQYGREILDFRDTSRHYLRSWFAIDLMANLPFELLLLAVPAADSSFISAAVLFRGLHMLRFLRLFVIFGRWEVASWTNPALLRVIKYVSVILLVMHWTSCLWFLVPSMAGFPEQSWVARTGIIDQPGPDQYTRSLYWTITTMTTVGYGDITPAGRGEYLLAAFVMLLGASLYAFIIGSVANLLGNVQAARNRHWEHSQAVTQFLYQRNVPTALNERVRNYYEYMWHRHRGMEQDIILGDLPQSLKLEIVEALAADTLSRVALYQHCGAALQKELLRAMEFQVYPPESSVVRAGEAGDGLYFMVEGKADIISQESGQSVGTLVDGDSFGALSLTLEERRTATLMATAYCEILVLKGLSFKNLLASYPEFHDAVKAAASGQSEATAALVLEGIIL